jgi:hypothetical protein
MNIPNSDELHQRYRSMVDDELLVVAAESASLTLVAATALKQELDRRRLTEADVKDASERLNELNAEDQEIRKALFDPRKKLAYAMRSLFLSALMLACWGISAFLARALFNSSQTQVKFEVGACFLFASSYTIWQAVVYPKRRQKKRRVTTSG